MLRRRSSLVADSVDLTLLALVVVVVMVVVVEHYAALSTLLLMVARSFASRLPAILLRVLLFPHLYSDLRVSPSGPLRPIRRIWWSTCHGRNYCEMVSVWTVSTSILSYRVFVKEYTVGFQILIIPSPSVILYASIGLDLEINPIFTTYSLKLS
jgi:hypothetical protein